MWRTKTISLEEVGIQGTYTLSAIPLLDGSTISKYNAKRSILEIPPNQVRAHLFIEQQLDQGSYGNIYRAMRNEVPVLIKQSRMVEMSLLQEGVLQHIASKVLEQEGIPWAIPKVYDIFWKDNQICFSMERIAGVPIDELFSSTTNGDLDTFFLLAQISLILATLETHLNLDHRDLKASNLLIKKEPCFFRLRLKDSLWTLRAPFTVVVLDFGFACLGSDAMRGKPLVNLGDGVLPPMDPCPKEGRDIFHLLVSLLGIPVFRDAISKRLHEKIDGWLSTGKKSYGHMARRWSTENWSYLVSSQPTFSIQTCCPLHILKELLPELRGFLGCS